MNMRKTFTFCFSAMFFRIMVLFAPFYFIYIYSLPAEKNTMGSLIFCYVFILSILTAIWFQHAVPLEIKTNEEGMTIRRWKKEKFYAWKDVKILLITKILFPLGRFDLHLLSEPFHKRYLMILGLNRKQRKELMQIVKQGIESYKGCS